ncbi:hypothetical protein QUF70_21090, partial [Desulfobacterales bacterium HSG17]|nr:hypothetical protein [Desulfobacterales bacterium HSG17]
QECLTNYLHDLTSDELDKLLKGIPADKRLKGIPADKRLKGIPANTLGSLLKKLPKGEQKEILKFFHESKSGN